MRGTCILDPLFNEFRFSHDIMVGFEISNQGPESNNIGELFTIFIIEQLTIISLLPMTELSVHIGTHDQDGQSPRDRQ